MDEENLFRRSGASFWLLLDPDKHTEKSIGRVGERAEEARVDVILLGSTRLEECSVGRMAASVKQACSVPVILFPGADPPQKSLSGGVDGFLCPVVLGARNGYFCGGWHELAAPYARSLGIKSLPVGYLVVRSSGETAVERVVGGESGMDRLLALAVTAEMLGLRAVYLEGGSGTCNPVDCTLVTRVRKEVALPLIVGGGIRLAKQVSSAVSAGADAVVVGSVMEDVWDQELLVDMVASAHRDGEQSC